MLKRVFVLLTVFVFAFFSVALADDYIEVNSGGGGAGGGHTIQDESVSLAARTNLDFQGAGVTVTDGGAGPDSTIVTISGGGSSSDNLDQVSDRGAVTNQILTTGGLGTAGVISASTVTGNAISANTAFLSIINSNNIGTSIVTANTIGIGTGTAAPLDSMEIVGGNLRMTAGAAQGLKIYSGTTLLGSMIRGTADSTAVAVLQGPASRPITVQNSDGSTNAFQWTNSSSAIKGVIDSSGQVGILNKSPTHSLDVLGTGYFNGTLGAGAQITANSVSFNTIAWVSTNTIVVGGAWKLPTWDADSSLGRQVIWSDGKGNVSWNTVSATGGGSTASTDAEVVFNFNGGSSDIVTGSTAFVRMPYDATITGWDIVTHANLAKPEILFAVSMQTVTYANWDTMTNIHLVVNPPQIKGVKKNTSTSLGGWTTSLTKGNYIQATVVSCNSVTQSSVVLFLTKT